MGKRSLGRRDTREFRVGDVVRLRRRSYTSGEILHTGGIFPDYEFSAERVIVEITSPSHQLVVLDHGFSPEDYASWHTWHTGWLDLVRHGDGNS